MPVTSVIGIRQERLVPFVTELKHAWPTSWRCWGRRSGRIWHSRLGCFHVLRWAAGEWQCAWAVTGKPLVWNQTFALLPVPRSWDHTYPAQSQSLRSAIPEPPLSLQMLTSQETRNFSAESLIMLPCHLALRWSSHLAGAVRPTSGWVGALSGVRVENSHRPPVPYVHLPQGPWRTLAGVLGAHTQIHDTVSTLKSAFTCMYFPVRSETEAWRGLTSPSHLQRQGCVRVLSQASWVVFTCRESCSGLRALGCYEFSPWQRGQECAQPGNNHVNYLSLRLLGNQSCFDTNPGGPQAVGSPEQRFGNTHP